MNHHVWKAGIFILITVCGPDYEWKHYLDCSLGNRNTVAWKCSFSYFLLKFLAFNKNLLNREPVIEEESSSKLNPYPVQEKLILFVLLWKKYPDILPGGQYSLQRIDLVSMNWFTLSNIHNIKWLQSD